ncbi:arylmalonate decarboxylase [Actinomadura sp. 9N215]|uniref:aspartate racemase/maleate isomerase family protein n=1 Tax=Actinomadura sp. 9N215 TaxID=3375150 RepID=UPI0037AFC9C9
MPDAVGHRAKFGVIVPSTNTVVEHDYNAVSPRGVTFHAGRMYIEQPALASDQDFEGLLVQIRASINTAIRDVMTAQPDHLVMGMSAETFWGGVDGNQRFEDAVRAASGLAVTTGATATCHALKTLGVQRIACVTPYQPIADAEVERFYTESGFDVVAVKGLKCPSATAIAAVTEDELIAAMKSFDMDGVDAVVQVGTNLSMLRLAPYAERWLGVPVVAINAATLWQALRSNGFNDRFDGFGTLLRDH